MTNIPSFSDKHDSASAQVLRLTIEAYAAADVIAIFRNIIPSVQSYVHDTVVNFKASDSVDLSINRYSLKDDMVDDCINKIKMIKHGHLLLQAPEGFNDKYIPYLKWLIEDGVQFINDTDEILQSYYTELSVFISSKDAKLSLKNLTPMYSKIQKNLDKYKDGLASFFDSKSSNSLRPLDTLFDRPIDIKTAVKLSKDLNRIRLTLSNNKILSMIERISALLDLLSDTSGDQTVPDVSKQAAASIAEGAMAVARQVEFVAVVRYRMIEAISAMGIMVTMLNTQLNKVTE